MSCAPSKHLKPNPYPADCDHDMDDLVPSAKAPTGVYQRQTQSRITVVESLYYQPPNGGSPASYGSQFARWVGTSEQPYVRRTQTHDAEWHPLDTGWVRNDALLLLSNESGKNMEVNPTKEELERISRQVLELSVAPDLPAFCSIPPGESARFQMRGKLYLRSTVPNVFYLLHVLPTS